MDTCHICLDDSIPQEIIKECCDAFICNDCWIRLKDNPETFQCPICKYPINNHVTINVETERSFYDRYEKLEEVKKKLNDSMLKVSKKYPHMFNGEG